MNKTGYITLDAFSSCMTVEEVRKHVVRVTSQESEGSLIERLRPSGSPIITDMSASDDFCKNTMNLQLSQRSPNHNAFT